MKQMNVVGVILLVCIAMVACVTAGSYAPIVPNVGDGCGTLEISVLCQHNLFSKNMSVERVDDSNTLTFTNGGKVSKERFNQFSKIGDPVFVNLKLDGKFDGRFAPGVYAVKLMDGDGGQPEYAIVKIELGYESHITFIGHATSGVSGKIPEPVCNDLSVTITEYQRGFIFSWYRISVVNSNDLFTTSHVRIEDTRGHAVYDLPVVANSGQSYSFWMPFLTSHWNHRPLTVVSIENTQCKECNEESNVG